MTPESRLRKKLVYAGQAFIYLLSQLQALTLIVLHCLYGKWRKIPLT